MDRMAYCNDLMARIEELFWHELSDCAGWKTEFIGTEQGAFSQLEETVDFPRVPIGRQLMLSVLGV